VAKTLKTNGNLEIVGCPFGKNPMSLIQSPIETVDGEMF